MDVTISAGGLADVDALAPLWTAMVEHHREVAAGTVPVRPADEAWERRRAQYVSWLEDGSGLLFLARPAHAAPAGPPAPVGYAFCRLVPSGATYDLGPLRGDVESLAVAPETRGSGVGTALLEACRAELLARGCTYWSIGVAAANTGAVQLYERVGFRPWVQSLVARLEG